MRVMQTARRGRDYTPAIQVCLAIMGLYVDFCAYLYGYL